MTKTCPIAVLGIVLGLWWSGFGVSERLMAQALGDPPASAQREYEALLEADDEAQAEVDRWIRDNHRFVEKGAGVEEAVLRARIRTRLGKVKDRYEVFLRQHPDHARARLAYGSFLIDIHEEEEGLVQMEKSLELDPTNPAAWNNLANFHGHRGPVAKSFDFYAKAIELDPTESIYYHNFATTVYMFRRDATNHFKLTEQEVFEKAMKLYYKARELDPENFILATDVARTFYGIQPPRELAGEALAKAKVVLADQAIESWNVALKLARDAVERQGVVLHIARLHINAGRYDAAVEHLGQVKDEMFDETKETLRKRIERERDQDVLEAPGAPKAE